MSSSDSPFNTIIGSQRIWLKHIVYSSYHYYHSQGVVGSIVFSIPTSKVWYSAYLIDGVLALVIRRFCTVKLWYHYGHIMVWHHSNDLWNHNSSELIRTKLSLKYDIDLNRMTAFVVCHIEYSACNIRYFICRRGSRIHIHVLCIAYWL